MNNKRYPAAYTQGKPDLSHAFCLGITGHRPNRLNLSDLTLLHQKVRQILSVVLDILSRQGGPKNLIIVTPLAEGADRIAAIEGLKLGFSLYCPLPFPPWEYEHDFQDESSRKVFRDLLSKADFVSTLSEKPPIRKRQFAYRRSGNEVIRCSALLLAVWDGDPKQGDGGTAEIVESALSDGLPVIWIDSKADHAVRVMIPKRPVTNENLQKIIQILENINIEG